MEKITKTHTRKDKKTGEVITVSTEYCISADFVPAKVADICTEFIENYCVANNEVEWLCQKYESTIVDKDGKKRPYPFVNLRADFVTKFFPAIFEGKASEKVNYRAAFLAKYRK